MLVRAYQVQMLPENVARKRSEFLFENFCEASSFRCKFKKGADNLLLQYVIIPTTLWPCAQWHFRRTTYIHVIYICQSWQSLFSKSCEYCLNYARNLAWRWMQVAFCHLTWVEEVRQGKGGTATAAVGCCRRHEPSKSEKPQKCKPLPPSFTLLPLRHACVCVCPCVCVCVRVTFCALCKLNSKLCTKN